MTPHQKFMLYSMFYGSMISGAFRVIVYTRKLLGIFRDSASLHNFLKELKKPVDIDS